MNLSKIFLIFVCIILGSPSAAADQKTPELPQWNGQQNAGEDFSTRLIHTQEEWARFWKRAGREEPRALDETREAAVVIALGERPTGGYSLRIISATERDGKNVIVYAEVKPSPDSFVTQALTYPWVIAIVPKSSLKLETRQQAAP